MPISDLTLAEKVSTEKTAPKPVRATTGQTSWSMSNFLLDRGLINVAIRHVISSRVHVALHGVKRTCTEAADKAVDRSCLRHLLAGTLGGLVCLSESWYLLFG